MDGARVVEPTVHGPVALILDAQGRLVLLAWGRGLAVLVGQRPRGLRGPDAA